MTTKKPIERRTAKNELERINNYLKEKNIEAHYLIGGLAVQQYQPGRNSQDIDLICSFKIANDLIDELYPSLHWEKEDKNNDEYRPSYHIKEKGKKDSLSCTIVFGPKILERGPYEHIEWEELTQGDKPFKGIDGKELEKILIFSPHALAYTKMISSI